MMAELQSGKTVLHKKDSPWKRVPKKAIIIINTIKKNKQNN